MNTLFERLTHFLGRFAFVWEEGTPRWLRYAHRCVTHAIWVIGAAVFFAWLGLPGLPEALVFVFLSLIAFAFAMCVWPFLFATLSTIGFFLPRLNGKLHAVNTWLDYDKPLLKSEDGLIDEWTDAPNSRLTKAQLRRALERYARKANSNE